MITIEEKRENFRRWWKKYIKIYSKEFILEHLDGIAETIFNSVLNCDIKIFDIDPWHYPSKGEYPTESGKYFVTIIRYKETGEMVVDTDVDRWNGFSWCYFEPIAWMPLPEPPKEKA